MTNDKKGFLLAMYCSIALLSVIMVLMALTQRERSARYNESHRAERAEKAKEAYWAKSEEERKAQRAVRSEYMRRWRDAHKDTAREYLREYIKENRERLSRGKKEYYLANRNECIQRARKRFEALPEEEKKKASARSQDWAKRHPEERLAYFHIRRTRQNGAGGSYTPEDITAIRKAQSDKCVGLRDASCKESSKRGLVVDHILPVALGGSSNPDNLQLLCQSCNSRKSRTHPDKWAARMGKLFV